MDAIHSSTDRYDLLPAEPDAQLDEIGCASFPASDPPGWIPVVRVGRPAMPHLGAAADPAAGKEPAE